MLVTAKATAFDSPPPGGGLKTVMFTVPSEARSLAEIVAVKFVEFTKLVGRLDPFHRTIEAPIKLEPLTVRVNPAVPITALDGEREVIIGTAVDVTLTLATNGPPLPKKAPGVVGKPAWAFPAI